MCQNTSRTIIPNSIIKFWFMSKLVGTNEHRAEYMLHFFLWCIDWIHNHRIFAIIGTKFNSIFFGCNYILYLVLIENSFYWTKTFAIFFANFRRNNQFATIFKRKRKHHMCRSNKISKRRDNIVHSFNIFTIITSAQIIWFKIIST